MKEKVLRFRFLGLLTVLAVLAGFSALAMLLWNWIMPEVFGLPLLNYWQAAGILALARILFGGVGRGHFSRGGRGAWDGRLGQGNKLREKWMNMSEEERRAFVEKEKDFRHFFHDRFSQRYDFGDDRRGAWNPRSREDAPSKEGDNE